MAISDGRKTVTTSGTAVALASSSTPVLSLAVQALPTNTGVVVAGASTVVAAAGSRRGYALSVGSTDALVLGPVDLANVYVDAVVNGEGVEFAYTT